MGNWEETVFDQSREVLLALDLSASMLADDVKPSALGEGQASDWKPSRRAERRESGAGRIRGDIVPTGSLEFRL